LEEIFLNWSPVKNLWGLKGLNKLKTIFCDHTEIEDLYPVSTLSNLRSIYCSYTKIKSLESAYGHPKIQFIQCDNSLITDREVQNSRYHIKKVSNIEPNFSLFDNQEAKAYFDKVHQEEVEKVRKSLKENDEE
jgi:Leucine-rich repeat (LRR) protein